MKSKNFNSKSESDEDLEQHFFLSMDLFCIAKTNGEFIRLNNEWEKVLGYTEVELKKSRFLDFVHPDDIAITLKAISELENQQEVLNFENRYRCKDGTYRLFEWRFRPKGNLIYSIGRDISAQKRADEAALATELRYRNFIENMQETFYEVNVDGTIIDVSPSVKSLSKGQYKPENLIGKPLFDLYADYQERGIFLETLQKNDIVTDYEIKLRNLDGTIIDCSISSKLQRNADGTPLKIIGSLVDITKRKQAERALHESESRFKALHNASFGGISIHDQGTILDCNQGLSDMTGYSMDELIGMDGLLLIAEKSRSYVMNKIVSGYEKSYEAIGLRKNRVEYPMLLQARNVPYRGKMVRTVEFRDITEQKQHEMTREKLQIELTQAQKMESVGRLAGGVAHDFNNMLGVILGYSELILDQVGEDHKISTSILGIQQAAMRSADLTRQLLAFARRQTVAPEVIDLDKTLGSMLNMLRRIIGENIDLEWLPAKNLGKIKIDPSQIDQILANLAVNARDSINETGKITIETDNVTIDETYTSKHLDAIPGEYVLLAVSDNGSGMDAKTLSHLFEPFFTTKETGKGTGLGLATVYGIVKQNSGFINVYSQLGQGTTFKIYLPNHTTEFDIVSETETTKNTYGIETILIVEDEPTLLKMTGIMVQQQGYTVFTAATPAEAIRLAKEFSGKIHLLLTDVIMPEMNGRDLVRKLLTISPNLKHLFMSGYTANVIAHHGVLDEDVNFIQKPFTKKDLAFKIRKALDKISS